MRNNNIIKSSFKKSEEFSYDDTPKHFGSVTERSIKRLRRRCLRSLSNKYNHEYRPAALEVMLESIKGEFDPAYVELEGDYGTRRANLQSAYSEGLADLLQSILQIEVLISNHNQLFENYAEATEAISGRRPLDQTISPATVEQYREQYKLLDKD